MDLGNIILMMEDILKVTGTMTKGMDMAKYIIKKIIILNMFVIILGTTTLICEFM